jgi:hypothetical protein
VTRLVWLSRCLLCLSGLLLLLAACSGVTATETAPSGQSSTISTSSSGVPPLTSVGAFTTVVTTTSPRSHALEPITGYGDFSDQEFYEIDWFLVNRLTIQCLQENGFPVTVVSPGDGISFHSVPVSQNQLAQQYLEACRAGLNLPEFEWPTPEQLEVMYAYYVALRDCLIDEGYAISEPPSLDPWIDSFTTGPWTPYLDVPGGGSGWDSIQMKCPQAPPGGWATWEPGDPIIPITPPGS